jgi:succinate dehydrogenase flavin-adding protein (antitoxin of CptAB toxin-antitoxin module)
MKQEIEDSIVVSVMTKFYERSQVGIKKYNTTLDRDDYDLLDWLREAQEESLDFALYCEAAMKKIKNK